MRVLNNPSTGQPPADGTSAVPPVSGIPILGSLRHLLGADSDEECMRRVRVADDPAAFARLVRKWEAPIRRLATRMTGDASLAEDLAQDVFARVHAHRDRYEPGGRFSTWLWRIALNRCHDELRRVRRHGECPLEQEEGADHPGVDHLPPAPESGPDAVAIASDQAALVRRALGRLPETHRSVVLLRHYEDLKFREIAEVLGLPEGTVKSRMAESMTLLARWLAPAMRDPASESGAAPAPRKR